MITTTLAQGQKCEESLLPLYEDSKEKTLGQVFGGSQGQGYLHSAEILQAPQM